MPFGVGTMTAMLPTIKLTNATMIPKSFVKSNNNDSQVLREIKAEESDIVMKKIA